MKILFLSAYAFPEKVASSHLGESRNKTFAEFGFTMEAYAPTPCRGISKDDRLKYSSKEYRTETFLEGKYILNRFPLFAEPRNPFLRALRYSICWFIHFWKGLRAQNIDVIFLSSTPPIQGLLGVALKKIKKIPFIYNLQDIFPDSLVGVGLANKNSILWKIGRFIENLTYKHADKIIVISDDFKSNIMNKGVPEDKIEVIYNWVDVNAIYPVYSADNPLYKDLKIDDNKFNVVYAGNFGNAQNIDIIIKTADILRDTSDIQFLLFGSGGLYDMYKKNATDMKLTNVLFYPLQPLEKVKYVYSLGNVSLICCKKGLGKGAFPSKTWSIMAAGTPVVANYDSGTDLERIITKNQLGMFSQANDAEQMAQCILEMYNNPELCKQFGENARNFVEQYMSSKIATERYVNVIKEILG